MTKMGCLQTMHQAIEALNEEGGSTEQSISSHIRPQHPELPCSHKAFLSHHPKRLTDQGQLLVTPQGTYTLPNQHIPRPCGEDQREQTQRTGLASVLRWPKRWQEEAAQHQRTRGKPIWRHVTAREAEGRRSEGKCRKES
ncbi:hypothetical protein EUGRSUZ_K02265 [Eucalyptus grandis]|uniref:Uncharacterized protein n=2 Tax=Eucalyptus grandis TaxID=71139 RepID=A0ACC3IVW1_EUCGR|nr:hypothetical protein EUGRSUZ_K02265 [Eucalyptus grandis]